MIATLRRSSRVLMGMGKLSDRGLGSPHRTLSTLFKPHSASPPRPSCTPAYGSTVPEADLDYAALLRFRTALRRFNRWSEEQAAVVGLTHVQHQLLLAVKGHSDARGPTISDVAEYLLVRHHSVVELATRVEALGFLARHEDEDDGRLVRLRLTVAGEDRIRALTEVHVRELSSLAPLLRALVDGSKPDS